MLVVLANSGFLPIFENGILGALNKNIKIAEAQTAFTTTGDVNTTKNYEKAKVQAQKLSGYYNGQNQGGVYQDAYKYWIAQGNSAAQAKVEANRIAQEAYADILPYAIKQQEAATGGDTKKYDAATEELVNRVVDFKNEKQILPADQIDQARADATSAAAIQAQQNSVNQTSEQVESNARVQTAIDTAPDQSTEGRAKAAKAERERQASESEAGKPNDKGPIVCGFSVDTMVGKVGNGGTFEGCVAIGAYIFLKLSAWFLQIVGLLFNATLNFTLNLGKVIPSGSENTGPIGLGGSAGAIYVGWTTIRDFINVAFIFVLLFAAISIILQTDKYGLQKTITKVVIAALLLNFSLFFTKAIIDLSNIVALQFYSRIMDAAAKAGGNTSSIDGGLSAGLANTLGLQSIWVFGEGVKSQSSLGMNAYDLTVISLFGGIFLLVFAFVLFMATVQFILRSIVLIFLMITSPVGFVGGAIPGLEKISSEWWSRLKNNAIFAPAYTAVMYISCIMIFGPAREGIAGNGNIAQLITGHTKYQFIGIAVWFVFVIGFLIASHLSARGFADKFGSSFTGKAEKWFKSAPLLRYTGATALARIGLGNSARVMSENRVTKRLLTAPGIKQLGGQKLYNSIKDLQEVKIGGKSYKDAVGERVKEDQTTFERLGETTVRRRDGESDDNFKKRQTYADNATTRAQARFMGLSVNDTNIKKDDVKGTSGAPIQKRKWIFWKENLKEEKLSDAAFKQYKKDTSETLGSGFRKSRKEVGKKASSGIKGSVTDIEKQIEKALENQKNNKISHKANVALRETQLKAVQDPDDTIHETQLLSSDPAHQRYKVRWIAAKKQLDKAKLDEEKDQEKIDELYRKLRQAENAGKSGDKK